MKKDVLILIAEDDQGHASLISRNLNRAGIGNDMLHFTDGQQVLDFLFSSGAKPHRESGASLLLLLDIRMPKVDGVEVLRRIKESAELRKMPVIMITTTDDPHEVERCHTLGCSSYITKPIDYDKFVQAVRQLGLFLLVVEVPALDGN